MLGLLAAEPVFVERTATPEALRRNLSEHGVAWLRVECSELVLASEGAARESMLCLRVDGTPLVRLSEQLGERVRSRADYLDDLADGSAPLLVSSALGEPVGPFETEDGWRVVVVERRVSPTTDDPELVRRATSAVVRSGRERVKAGRARELVAL